MLLVILLKVLVYENLICRKRKLTWQILNVQTEMDVNWSLKFVQFYYNSHKVESSESSLITIYSIRILITGRKKSINIARNGFRHFIWFQLMMRNWEFVLLLYIWLHLCGGAHTNKKENLDISEIKLVCFYVHIKFLYLFRYQNTFLTYI